MLSLRSVFLKRKLRYRCCNGCGVGDPDASWREHSVEPCDGCVVERSDPRKLLARAHAAEVPGRGGVAAQAVPHRHMLGGEGGKRGPVLDAVALRMTEDQIIRQVLQGGGNMGVG